ncbi:MAG: hypothetical protein ACXVGN_13335, partial [Mycobacteriaceae bacterium]
MSDFPDWWRGQRPPVAYDGRRLAPIIQGPLLTLDVDDFPPQRRPALQLSRRRPAVPRRLRTP